MYALASQAIAKIVSEHPCQRKFCSEFVWVHNLETQHCAQQSLPPPATEDRRDTSRISTMRVIRATYL